MKERMRVGILGTHWGRLHVGAFRSAGATVHAIVGADPRASADVARAEGIACSTFADLEDCDVIVIASPTSTHRGYAERFSHKAILCEKPLLGAVPDDAFVRLVESIPLLYVSYALPFVPAARAFVEAARGATTYDARVRVSLPEIRDEHAAAREVAVHPAALLFHALGEEARGRLSVELGGEAGIEYEVRAARDEGQASFAGRYAPGSTWTFDARHPDGHVTRSFAMPGEADVWYEAHCSLARTFVDRARESITASEARVRGLLHGTEALAVERMVRALSPEGSR